MSLTRVISYGGSYKELWDSDYRLSVEYSGQSAITMVFRNGQWYPEDGWYPPFHFSELFFRQAAGAAVFAREFIASGLTRAFEAGSDGIYCTGPVFVAECLRILLDDFGLQYETVYPYLITAWNTDLTDDEFADLLSLQPRTAKLYRLVQDRSNRIPVVRHDIRLSQFRAPYGAVETGTQCFLSIENPSADIQTVTLELYGDSLQQMMPMQRHHFFWTAKFDAPSDPVALWYRFRLETENGPYWLCAAGDGIHGSLSKEEKPGFRFTVYERGFTTPLWFQNAVLYQVFPDRFGFSNDGTAERGIAYHMQLGQSPELHMSTAEEVRWQPRPFESSYIPDDFYGGTLKGIAEKLPELRSLGVTCLYLNPIFEARSNHRYDTADYKRIDPILGDNHDFKELCRRAADFNIRILCDGVFSHTGADSVYFNRDGHYPNPGACQNEASEYDEWYEFQHFPDQYRSWWGFSELPEVEELNPHWQNFMITGNDSVIRRWLRLGAAGWRLDVADELPDSVLQLIRRVVKEENSDYLILGEVWEDAVLKESYGARRSYALGNALDSVMNYPFRKSVLDFLHRRTSAFELADFLNSQQLHYPAPLYRALMNLLGSHDVERLRTSLGTDVELKGLSREEQLQIESSISSEMWRDASAFTRLAYLIAFSIPGVPSIYYGDELGMTGVNDPFNRRPFGELAYDDLRIYLSELSLRRHNHPVLRNGEVFCLAGDQDILLILSRSELETVLTVINRSFIRKQYSLSFCGLVYTGEIAPLSGDTVFLTGENDKGCAITPEIR